MELKKYKIGDLVQVTRGASLGGEFYATQGNYVRLTCGNFDYRNNCFKENQSKDNIYYTGGFKEEFLLEKGDIITPLTEQAIGLLGSTARIPESGKYIQSQDIAKIDCNESLLDKDFAFYLISSACVKQQLSAAAQQTKIRHTSPDKIKECTVWIPSLDIQKRIGRILTDIDNKIAINRQINDNLEAMAKQLYDYWFVQFDFPNEEGKPYKSNGGAMVWNEKLKREIPQRWSDCVLGDYIGRITNGLNPRKNFVLGSGNNYYVTIRSLVGTTIDWNNCDRCDDEALSKINSRSQLQIGDIIFSAIGTIGRTYYILEEPTNWNISETSFTLRAKENVPNDFFYGMLRSNEIQIKADKAAMGSTLRCLVMDSLCSLQYIEIPNYMMKLFAAKVSPLYRQIHRNNKEIAELTKQRDELLPLLMNGQATVNYHLSASFLSSLILYRDQYKFYDMKETIIQTVLDGMRAVLTENQLDMLTDVTRKALSECEITPKATEEEQRNKENVELLGAFISSKKVEGCSDKTIHYYKSSIEKLIATVKKNVCDIATNDIRCYLAEQQEQRGLSKVTIDNLRRIYSSFFSWLEDEDYITKSPVRRIHKVRTDALVKEVLTDENIEVLRDSCQELRDIAMIDLLLSTGMRVGELVKINREDIDFQERQCIVFGKGNKEREVYFNARTKIHLKKYLEQRTDTNPALFVSLHEPHTRLTISGVEVRLRQLGKRVNLNKVHPHKFRRTLATMAIDKGMPIEQVQKMLGHVKIDTTLHYAMVNQTNVKIAHRKFLN